ncbi:uncharacterized protein LOC144626643 [Crassostrea virginica]
MQREQIEIGASLFESFPTVLQGYMQQLLTCKGFTPIGVHFDKFVLRDYDLKERNLEANKFVFVSRRSKCFMGNYFHWCFTCTCNTSRSALVNGLSGSIDISFDASNGLVQRTYIVLNFYFSQFWKVEHVII